MRVARRCWCAWVEGSSAFGMSFAALLAALAAPSAASAHAWRFEPNRGQAAPEVRYLARGPGYTVYLTADEVVLRPSNAGEPRASAPLRMRLHDGGKEPRIEAREALPGSTHYLRGGNRSAWVRDVPAYARVAYREVHPGIDLVLHGEGGRLEYDWIVAPGADPSRIELRFSGGEPPALDRDGGISIRHPSGELRHAAPVAWQEIGGERRRVASHFVAKESGSVGVVLGALNPSRSLVIDPVLTYSTLLGGSADEFGRSVAVDARGDIYVAGGTASVDFPVTAGPLAGNQLGGALDAFVAKLDGTTGQLIHATYLGGSLMDVGRGIAVDTAGYAYVTGQTQSTDFPIVNPLQPNRAGNYDAFVAKLSPSGSALAYSTYLGGSDYDSARAIAVDATGRVVLMGQTRSADLPTHAALQPQLGGENDAFVAKLEASGSAFAFSTYLGGSDDDLPFTDAPLADPPTSPSFDLDLDPENAIYLAGTTESLDFPTANALQPAFGGARDGFVAKLDPSGATLVYSTYLGRLSGDTARGIDVDRFGNAYVIGGTRSTDFPTTGGVAQPQNGGFYDAFVLKLDRTGTQLLYSTFLGGTAAEGGEAIAVDVAGNAHVLGHTRSSDFPTADAFQPQFGGGIVDTFVAKLDPTASNLLYSSFLGGSGLETPLPENMGLALDPRGDAVIVGSTASSDFPTAGGQATLAGGFDAFVARIRTVPTLELRIEDSGGTRRLVVTMHNPGATDRQVEFKLWKSSVAGAPASLQSQLLVAQPGPPTEIVNLLLPSSLPFPGTTLSGRLLDPATGVVLSEDVCAATPCP